MASVSVSVLAFLSVFFFCSCIAKDPKYPYQVKYFDQYIDHFNEVSYKDHTFKQKYLYSDKNWKAGSGPIFICTGNGPIEAFWKVFGFVHEMAAEMGAAVVFAEHRFFGTSMPFGKDSLKTPYLGLLSVSQALADNALLVTDIVKTNNCSHCKVIAIGGSYGGMMAAYMRMKYPDLVQGALASSAPVSMQDSAAPRDFFFRKVTEDFQAASKLCADLTIRVFTITEMLAKDGAAGLKSLSRYFKLCEPLNNLDDFHNFQGWLRHGFVSLSMLNYPYATDIFGYLPANPVHVACKALTSAHNAIYGLGDLVGVFYNTTRNLECYNISQEYVQCADPTGCSAGPDDISWDYLSCTELWSPDSSNGRTDMFPNMPWTTTMKDEYCQKNYGVTFRPDWMSIQFWGEDLRAASNIIFSNGDLDPWSGGSVLRDVSDTVVAVEVKGGAHHFDLFGTNKADPAGVTEARQKEKAIIKSWIGL